MAEAVWRKSALHTAFIYYDYENRVFMAMEMRPLVTPFGTIFVPDEGGRAPGDARMYGADIQISAIISTQDKLDISISYLDAYVTNYVKNVFDYAEKRFMNMGAQMNLGPPRTYGAVLSINY